MIFAIDHFVLSAAPAQASKVLTELQEAGFVSNNFVLNFDETNSESESLSYDGGGMVEVRHSREQRPNPTWFAEVPRVIGLGFGSDDFFTDTAWGSDLEEGHWTMTGELLLPDGSPLRVVAAGPHRHASELYVFVMDRPNGQLQFPDVPAVPHLVSVTVSGPDANLWRDRLQRWLHIADGPVLRVGDVDVRFEETGPRGVRVTPTFRVPSRSSRIALDGSSIEFVSSCQEP
jgi:hypothetical protein